jgi:uncharacterized C2H2 Zn-finger protein
VGVTCARSSHALVVLANGMHVPTQIETLRASVGRFTQHPRRLGKNSNVLQTLSIPSNFNPCRKHIRTHVKPVLCPMCQHTNQTQPIMRRHLETHFVKKKGGDALICELCNADFTRRDNFLRHTNKQHPDAAAKSSKTGKS